MKIPENKESPFLKYNQELSESMDYAFLRKEGIRFVQELSGKIWTDYNEHDPGVTILEQCCFALTDIAYRTNIDIEKLLFSGGDRNKIAASNSLYVPEEILLSANVTLQDNKMFFLDRLKSIGNIWFKKTMDQDVNGLYDIYVQPASALELNVKIEQDVRELFAQNRSLCEDINKVIVLQPEDLEIAVTIDLYEEYEVEEVLAEIYFQLDSYFNYKIQYESLETLVNKGFKYEQIFDRPSFDKNKGFMSGIYLEDYQTTFSFSKIQTKILEVKGVRHAQDLVVRKNGIKIGGEQISIQMGNFASLTTIIDKPGIVVNKNHVRIDYNIEKVKSMYQQKISEVTKKYFFNSAVSSTNRNINAQDISTYVSIQNTFPITYGIGHYGLSGNEGNERIYYAKQLQSYLLFFDQILLNHLSQLKNIPNLFSIGEDRKEKTYFEQLPVNVPNVDEITKPELMLNDNLYRLLDDKCIERKNKLLDHLLARFSERFIDEDHHNLQSIYGISAQEKIDATLVRLKYSFLGKYKRLSQNKNKAYNFNLPSWNGKALYDETKFKEDSALANGYPFKEKLFLFLNLPEENLGMGSLLSDYSQLKLKDIGERERKDMITGETGKKGAGNGYYKTYKEESLSGKVKFLLPEGQKAIDNLVYYGANEDSYSISKSEQGKVKFRLFFKSINDNLPLALGEFDSFNEAKDVIKKLANKFTVLNKNSEGFHVVEHVLLRPMLEEQYEIEITIDKEKGVLFNTIISDSYDEIKLLLGDLVINGLKKDQFVIKEGLIENTKKYYIYLKDKNGNSLLKLNAAYTSEAEAQAYINKTLVDFFKQMSYDKSLIHPSVQIKSLKNMVSNNDFDIELGVDLHSFYDSQISLIFPDWLPRFNEPDFRVLLQHSLARCLPAHIKVNQLWLKKERMQEFESVYFQWMKLKCKNFDREFISNSNVSIMSDGHIDERAKNRKRRNDLREEKLNLDRQSMELIRKLKASI